MRERDLAIPLYLYTLYRCMLEPPALAVLKHKASLIKSINIYGVPYRYCSDGNIVKKRQSPCPHEFTFQWEILNN